MTVCMVLEDFRLKIFVAVAETGSFTKAAAALGITQPAVSQNIAELEKCLNVRLFTRSRGEAVLTDGGRTFAKYAERILEWYAAADAMFGPEGRETGNRQVKVDADGFVASFVLPDLIRDILSVSGVDFTVRTYAFGSVPACPPEVRDAERDAADMCVYTTFRRRSPGYDESFFGTVPAAMFTGVDAADSSRLAVWSPYYQELSPDLAARVRMRSDSVESVISLVSGSSDLTGIVPLQCVRDNASVRILPEPLPHLRMDVHCKTTKEFAGTALCKLLCENMRKTFI